MRKLLSLLAVLCTLVSLTRAYSQTIELNANNLEPIGATMSLDRFQGKNTVKVIKDTSVKAFDEPTFVRLKNVTFNNGTIEVNVFSKLLPNAPQFARGFIGVAFRINGSYSKFECIYLRPANG